MQRDRIGVLQITLLAALCWMQDSQAVQYIESDFSHAAVTTGKLPPVAERLPANPAVVTLSGKMRLGQHGGRMRLLMGKEKDIRMMTVYGYARLVAFTPSLALEPDLLSAISVREGREFTMTLREGHKWSDGHPFTAEDFRFWWEDVVLNADLSKHGPPVTLIVDGELPEVEFPDATTVIYRWHKPNPLFLSELAGARPLYIYAPAHYLKQYHMKYTAQDKLDALVEKYGKRNWASVYYKFNKSYRQTNIKLPTLQPWINTVKPPSERFIFVRNPYYHRVDTEGRQLPYIDEVEIRIASSSLVPAKTGAGESDLQARHLRLDNVPFLAQSEERNQFDVRLWSQATGSHITLFPNLNSTDPTWSTLAGDVRFRRALSLLIDREEINQVVYFGLVAEGANTVLPESPLYKPEYASRWAIYDPTAANALLDEIGLTERNERGLRLMPDGRPLEIIVHTAGESTEETDVLELIHDSWMKGGIKLFTRPSQREVFRDRVYAGDAMMSVWSGIPNGLPTPELAPDDFVPSAQEQYQWPRWGQYVQTRGGAGVAPDQPEVNRLLNLGTQWRKAISNDERRRIWHEILAINADQVYTLGTVRLVPQPVVVSTALNNVPDKGIYNWNPGAFFGMYRPDVFWFNESRRN